MQNVDGKEVFENLKTAILEKKDLGDVNKNSEVISVAFSSLNYSITSEKTETVSFSALDLNLILNSDGSLMLMELEPAGVEFYEIENPPLENKLLEHLVWRTELLSEFGI